MSNLSQKESITSIRHDKLLNDVTNLVSRKWTLAIVRALDIHTKRHSELNKELLGITQKVLTETLRDMERSGIVDRIIHPTIPPRVEYQLTNTGLELARLSKEFASWFDTHHEDLYRAQKSYDRRAKS